MVIVVTNIQLVHPVVVPAVPQDDLLWRNNANDNRKIELDDIIFAFLQLWAIKCNYQGAWQQQELDSAVVSNGFKISLYFFETVMECALYCRYSSHVSGHWGILYSLERDDAIACHCMSVCVMRPGLSDGACEHVVAVLKAGPAARVNPPFWPRVHTAAHTTTETIVSVAKCDQKYDY